MLIPLDAPTNSRFPFDKTLGLAELAFDAQEA